AEAALSVGGVKAMPAVRAMARKLKIDIARVRGSGADGVVAMDDVKRAATDDSALLPSSVNGRGAGREGHAAARPHPHPLPQAGEGATGQRTALSASGRPMRTQPPTVSASGQPEQLKGVRRNMARVMADAHAKVVPTTLNDD